MAELTQKQMKAYERTTGIELIPHIFPWKWLGCTDNAFMEPEMKFSDGKVIPEDHKLKMLKCIREQEEILRNCGPKPKKQPKYIQLELF